MQPVFENLGFLMYLAAHDAQNGKNKTNKTKTTQKTISYNLHFHNYFLNMSLSANFHEVIIKTLLQTYNIYSITFYLPVYCFIYFVTVFNYLPVFC